MVISVPSTVTLTRPVCCVGVKVVDVVNCEYSTPPPAAAHAKPKACVLSAVNTVASTPIGILACRVEKPDKSPFVVVGGAISVGVAHFNPKDSAESAVNTCVSEPIGTRAFSVVYP